MHVVHHCTWSTWSAVGNVTHSEQNKKTVARVSVDRTAYSPKYSLSFMSHHAERISLSDCVTLLCEA